MSSQKLVLSDGQDEVGQPVRQYWYWLAKEGRRDSSVTDHRYGDLTCSAVAFPWLRSGSYHVDITARTVNLALCRGLDSTADRPEVRLTERPSAIPSRRLPTVFLDVGVGADVARGLQLRHDWGPPYRSAHFLGSIAWLGISDDAAFLGEPETNGCVER